MPRSQTSFLYYCISWSVVLGDGNPRKLTQNQDVENNWMSKYLMINFDPKEIMSKNDPCN